MIVKYNEQQAASNAPKTYAQAKAAPGTAISGTSAKGPYTITYDADTQMYTVNQQEAAAPAAGGQQNSGQQNGGQTQQQQQTPYTPQKWISYNINGQWQNAVAEGTPPPQGAKWVYDYTTKKMNPVGGQPQGTGGSYSGQQQSGNGWTIQEAVGMLRNAINRVPNVAGFGNNKDSLQAAVNGLRDECVRALNAASVGQNASVEALVSAVEQAVRTGQQNVQNYLHGDMYGKGEKRK